jgi:hypothetical protein
VLCYDVVSNDTKWLLCGVIVGLPAADNAVQLSRRCCGTRMARSTMRTGTGLMTPHTQPTRGTTGAAAVRTESLKPLRLCVVTALCCAYCAADCAWIPPLPAAADAGLYRLFVSDVLECFNKAGQPICSYIVCNSQASYYRSPYQTTACMFCRAATVLMYLGDVEEGGETTLPLGKYIDEGRQRLANSSECGYHALHIRIVNLSQLLLSLQC